MKYTEYVWQNLLG